MTIGENMGVITRNIDAIERFFNRCEIATSVLLMLSYLIFLIGYDASVLCDDPLIVLNYVAKNHWASWIFNSIILFALFFVGSDFGRVYEKIEGHFKTKPLTFSWRLCYGIFSSIIIVTSIFFVFAAHWLQLHPITCVLVSILAELVVCERIVSCCLNHPKGAF